MKLQTLIYETLITIIILLLIFLILSFLNIRKSEIEKKVSKIITYDAIFSLDAIGQLSKTSLSNLLKTYIFEFFEEGKIKNSINISCICNESQILFLNNLFKDGINVNRRVIKIYFFPTSFPLSLNDYKADGLIIWGCALSSEILNFGKYAGILFICDINTTFYNQNEYILINVFKASKNCVSNNLNDVILKKPLLGSNASYKVFKILTRSSYLYKFSENEEIKEFLNLSISIPICGEDILFVQKNNNNVNAASGIISNYYFGNVMILSANFLRNKNLDLLLTSNNPDDLKLKKLLSTLILVISKKKIEILPSYLENSINYVNYYFYEFLEPYLLTISIFKI